MPGPVERSSYAQDFFGEDYPGAPDNWGEFPTLHDGAAGGQPNPSLGLGADFSPTPGEAHQDGFHPGSDQTGSDGETDPERDLRRQMIAGWQESLLMKQTPEDFPLNVPSSSQAHYASASVPQSVPYQGFDPNSYLTGSYGEPFTFAVDGPGSHPQYRQAQFDGPSWSSRNQTGSTEGEHFHYEPMPYEPSLAQSSHDAPSASQPTTQRAGQQSSLSNSAGLRATTGAKRARRNYNDPLEMSSARAQDEAYVASHRDATLSGRIENLLKLGYDPRTLKQIDLHDNVRAMNQMRRDLAVQAYLKRYEYYHLGGAISYDANATAINKTAEQFEAGIETIRDWTFALRVKKGLVQNS